MGPKIWRIESLIKTTSDYLKKKGIDSPRLCAEILLAFALKKKRIYLYLNFEQPLHEKELSLYRSLIKRRLNREPLQYIIGTQEFWSMEFHVDPSVLIPRPESELLVEKVLELYDRHLLPGGRCPRILDVGTGAGVLPVAVAGEIRRAVLWASDISAQALKTARNNAERHGFRDRITFVQGDLLAPFKRNVPLFDAVLSNPPYVDSRVFDTLSPEVRFYEPRLALDGRDGGMFYVKEMIRSGPLVLKPGGWLMMEMGPEQTAEALKLIEQSGRFSEKARVKDYSSRYRVVMARRGA